MYLKTLDVLYPSDKHHTKFWFIFAREQMEKTKPLLAKKGRASFLGERSIGHLDPGSVSSFIIFETLCLSLIGEKEIVNELREQL